MSETLPLPSDELMARYDVAGPRYTSYPTVPAWQAPFGADDYAAQLRRASEREDLPLSLYFHLPFCKSLCWYCGCNVVISKEPAAADRYLDHLFMEMDMACALLGARRNVAQIHLGGGTPTFLSEAQLVRLWEAISARFKVLPEAEVAIEVHPSLTTDGQLTTLRKVGFNRLSMGLQDFDPEVQKATQRLQTVEQTRALLNRARALGFSGINLDLIYGLPMQTRESWARTMDQVLELRPDRLAVYSFAFMPDALKHQKRLPANALPTARTKLELFRAAHAAFVGAGYRALGMDHFAVPEDELSLAQAKRTLGRSFQGYTVTAAPDVVAFGSSAISDVGGVYAQNIRTLAKYYERISQGRFATERGCAPSEDDRERRAIITSLMCHFGADLGPQGADRYAAELSRLAPLEADGLVARSGARVEVTPLGRLFVRNVAMAFDAHLSQGGKPRFSRTV